MAISSRKVFGGCESAVSPSAHYVTVLHEARTSCRFHRRRCLSPPASDVSASAGSHLHLTFLCNSVFYKRVLHSGFSSERPLIEAGFCRVGGPSISLASFSAASCIISVFRICSSLCVLPTPGSEVLMSRCRNLQAGCGFLVFYFPRFQEYHFSSQNYLTG